MHPNTRAAVERRNSRRSTAPTIRLSVTPWRLVITPVSRHRVDEMGSLIQRAGDIAGPGMGMKLDGDAEHGKQNETADQVHRRSGNSGVVSRGCDWPDSKISLCQTHCSWSDAGAGIER